MQWNSEVWINGIFKSLVLFSPLILLIGFYKDITFLFAVGFLIMLIYGATLLQFKSAAKTLDVEKSKQTYRLFPGDTDQFYVQLLHKGKWPSFSGEMSFTHRDVISETGGSEGNEGAQGRIEISRPFAVSRNTAYKQAIPFKANRRGTTRISNLTVRVQDPLQAGGLLLSYQQLFPAEVIVYPELLPVYGIEQLYYQGIGEAARPFALYENDSLPAGTRNYTSGDSFHKIHWKATAKTGALQTKVFEKTVVYHWTFIYTIQLDHKKKSNKSTDEIEKEISYLAYMCKFAAEKGIPFEVYINFKVPGQLGVYHISSGSGSQHLMKILEGLARIDRTSMTVKPAVMWKKIDRNFIGSVPFVILLGSIPNDAESSVLLQKWRKSGGRIFAVNQNGNESYLMPYTSKEEISC
ncbi:DUF58 domain-containing protein [Fictibacillus barbaricus]|uniref:Uncharacterized protein (DUF58 family) n=1 Tax=Fictibacillus barbaricus TaxID=182136 RepID=A0ABU1TVN7_9BACL|nr:DUF58 domain-containing protein [Fictibacillus barbaricus]MDR7071277.1 uncharacterized protein (DUF58 family) [Fictibacillus barbaricus]